VLTMRQLIIFGTAIGLSLGAHAAVLGMMDDAPIVMRPAHPLEAKVTGTRLPKHQKHCQPLAQGKAASEHCRAAP